MSAESSYANSYKGNSLNALGIRGTLAHSTCITYYNDRHNDILSLIVINYHLNGLFICKAMQMLHLWKSLSEFNLCKYDKSGQQNKQSLSFIDP